MGKAKQTKCTDATKATIEKLESPFILESIPYPTRMREINALKVEMPRRLLRPIDCNNLVSKSRFRDRRMSTSIK